MVAGWNPWRIRGFPPPSKGYPGSPDPSEPANWTMDQTRCRLRSRLRLLAERRGLAEIAGERAGHRAEHGRAGQDQPKFPVEAQRVGREVLRADVHLGPGRALVHLEHLGVDVEAVR